MSIVGEQDAIAVRLRGELRLAGMEDEWIDEYWEGDPPAFQIHGVEWSEETDHTFVVTTSSGNRFRVTIEPEAS